VSKRKHDQFSLKGLQKFTSVKKCSLDNSHFCTHWWMHTFLNAAQLLVGAGVYNVFTTILP
jgi:hypothetical protein